MTQTPSNFNWDKAKINWSKKDSAQRLGNIVGRADINSHLAPSSNVQNWHNLDEVNFGSTVRGSTGVHRWQAWRRTILSTHLISNLERSEGAQRSSNCVRAVRALPRQLWGMFVHGVGCSAQELAWHLSRGVFIFCHPDPLSVQWVESSILTDLF